MSCISWNCRGVGSPSTILNLKYLNQTYKPDVIILFETLCLSNKIEELKYILNLDSCFCVDREGRGGGITILWRNSISFNITNYSQNHVDLEVKDNQKGMWRLTGFYSFSEGGKRKASWNFLRNLANLSSLSWCVIGDFNDILHVSEKKGRTDRPNWRTHTRINTIGM